MRRFSFILALAAGLSMAQTAVDLDSDPVNRVAKKMLCNCGCAQDMTCKMEPGCGICKRAKTQIFAMQQSGKSDSQILDQFKAENGPGIIAVTPGLFGTSGPFIALGLGAIAVLFLAGTGPARAQGCTGVSPSTTGVVAWTPQWCQEFSGSQASPDTTVWSFDLGNNNGWGNGEAEVYCGPPGYPNNPSQCPTTFSASTAPVYIDGNGHLVIQPRNVNGTWISGRMNTEGKQNFQYGILEARIQLPDTTNQGLWPAFWSLGSNISTAGWPTCGEADIMENWSPQVHNGAGPSGNNSTIHTAKTGGSGIGARYTFPSGQAANTAFHTYGVVWTQNEMQFFVDNASSPFFTVTPSNLPSGDTWPFNQNIFTLLNVAVGGTLGGSTSGLTNPQPMIVDYVRYYTHP